MKLPLGSHFSGFGLDLACQISRNAVTALLLSFVFSRASPVTLSGSSWAKPNVGIRSTGRIGNAPVLPLESSSSFVTMALDAPSYHMGQDDPYLTGRIIILHHLRLSMPYM